MRNQREVPENVAHPDAEAPDRDRAAVVKISKTEDEAFPERFPRSCYSAAHERRRSNIENDAARCLTRKDREVWRLPSPTTAIDSDVVDVIGRDPVKSEGPMLVADDLKMRLDDGPVIQLD
jgi:hypothetical protein